MSATKMTQLQHKRDTRNTSASQPQQKWHQYNKKCNTNNTSAVGLWHEQHDCDKSEKNDFDKNTSENIFYFIFGSFSFS